MKIGFLGLGNMGGPICGHLINAGHAVTAYDVSSDALTRIIKQGASGCTSPKEAAKGADIIFLSLPHPNISREVILGKDGILEGIESGALIAETSTVSPSLIKELAPAVLNQGGELLDAAVSGGVPGAIAGTLTLMVGGSEAGFHRLSAAMDAFGKNLFHCGGPGMGMLFKVINNMLAHVNWVALAEAVALGVKAGADPELLGNVVSVSSGRSAQIDDRLRKHVLPGNFTGGMKTELATKDSVLCLELARDLGVPVFLASAAHHIYELGIAKGYGEEEYGALIKLWEEWLDIEVRAK